MLALTSTPVLTLRSSFSRSSRQQSLCEPRLQHLSRLDAGPLLLAEQAPVNDRRDVAFVLADEKR